MRPFKQSASREKHPRSGQTIFALLGSLAIGLIAGCSSYQAPSLQVLDARVIEQTPEGAVVQFTIQATNQNNNPLPLRDVEYSLSLGGEQVFTGIRSPEATIRQSGTQQFTLPAAVKASVLPPAGSTTPYRLSGSLTYITPGAFAELLFDTGVRRPSTPLSGEGTLEWPGSLSSAPATPARP
ncbi:MAG: LEA type 2 family protein [Phycisphaerales bacterium]